MDYVYFTLVLIILCIIYLPVLFYVIGLASKYFLFDINKEPTGIEYTNIVEQIDAEEVDEQ